MNSKYIRGNNQLVGCSFHFQESGFTLIELMVTMLISMFLIAAISTAYISQQRSKTGQDQVVEMQRNARAALEVISADIRMAGFDPRGTAGAGIVTAASGSLQMTKDVNENGKLVDAAGAYDPNELIAYRVAGDADEDGIVDAGVASLGRRTGTAGGFQPVAENIQAIEFLYLLGDDLTPTLAPDPNELEDIRAITITVLARAANPDQHFSNSTVNFVPGSGAAGWPGNGVANDHFRRRLYTTTVNIRNQGL